MTTSIPHTHIRMRDLSELVAGIPYVIGFPPTESLVLYTFRRCPDLALSTTIRVDLPKPEHFSLVADELANAAVINEAVSVIAVAVGEHAEEHGELIVQLRKALADRGILLNHASWVDRVAHGEQWQCYDDPLCAGIVPDPQTSALAAACAVAGDTTYPNREAIAAHLASDPEEALAHRRKLLDTYRRSPAEPYTDAQREADLELLGMALDMALTSYDPPALTDDQLVRLGMALSQIPIKDECLAIALSDEREPAERLWTVLVRALPSPERAEPAFLLAMSAYLRGSGILAALALSIVMESDPLHRTGVLLDFALRMGIPPDQLRSMLMVSILKNDEEDVDGTVPEDDDPPWDTSMEQPGPASDPSASESPSAEEPPAESTAEPVHTVRPLHITPKIEPANDCAPSPSSPAEVESTIADDPELSSTGVVPESGTPHEVSAAPAADHGNLPEHPVEPVFDARAADTTEPAHPDDAQEVDEPELARTTPGALSQQAAMGPGIHAEDPVMRTVTVDSLTAFLPPPTDRIGPG